MYVNYWPNSRIKGVSLKEHFDEQVIDSAFNKIVESKTEYLETHFVYADDYYLVDYNISKLKSLILKGIKKYNIRRVPF